MKTTTRWSCWAAAALLALGSFGTGLVGCAPPQLRLALKRWIGYDTLWLADRLGFIAAEGLRSAIVKMRSTGGSCRLFDLGQVDVFGGTITPSVVRPTSLAQ